MESKKLSIKQNMIYNSVGSITYLFCQWLITIVVVRLSDYENAGILSLAMSINNILYALSTFGLRNYQVSDINNKYSDFEYIIVRCVTSLAGCFICIVFILINSTHYAYEQILCIFLYFLFKVTEAFLDVFQGIQQKQYRMDFVGKSYIIRGILTLGGFSIALKITGSLAAGIAAMIVFSALIAFGYDFNICKKLVQIGGKVNWSKIKAVLLENFPLMINEVLMTGIVSVARYFLELYEGNEILGIYSSIATPTVIIQAACNMIYSPLITEYAVHYKNKDYNAYKKLIFMVLKAFVAILAVVVLGVLLLGDWGLELLFGKEILAYSYLLIQTVLVTFMVAFMYWLSALMIVARKQTAVMIINGIAVIMVAVTSVIMIPQFSIDGINYALFISFAVDLILLALMVMSTVKKYFKEKD